MSLLIYFIFCSAPKQYADLVSLFEGRDEREQLMIIERLRKCHHPSLAEGNKEKLESLFSLLLQVRIAAFSHL